MPGPLLQHALAVLTTASLIAVPARISDPVGIYALVDRVVMEPGDTDPQRIQVWGVFALADKADRDAYHPAQRGYLYYTVNPENLRATRAEWQDLRASAGSGQVVAFGTRYGDVGSVRRAADRPARADRYPLGFGLSRTPRTPGKNSAEFQLVRVPAIASPADGATVKRGAVRLAVRNVADPEVRYIFEIVCGSDSERSAPLAPGSEQTVWTPQLQVEPGKQYEWRVHVTKGEWSGAPVVAAFRGER